MQMVVIVLKALLKYYFQKNNKDLSLAEIAFITAIPNNPSLYNPLNHMENTLKRKDN